tara:strand:- start:339 stop:515 length:177 start_codon:yes stop_codon:yes gene_type:complete
LNVGDLVILCNKTYEPEFVDDWGIGIVVSHSKEFHTADVFWFKSNAYRVFIDKVLEVI